MTNPIIPAFQILARFWLEEITPADLPTIAALPELAETLPNHDEAALTRLAVEYQRLFGFNLPPYESLFVDSSLMLMGRTSEQLQSFYRQAGWQLPADIRAGAPDHLGAELLALAGCLASGQTRLAGRLLGNHLAMWVPPFVLTLRRLSPHPFYRALSDLTLDLLLTTLGELSLSASNAGPMAPEPHLPVSPIPNLAEPDVALGDIVKWLLTPAYSGLFLTREELARIGQTLELPAAMGERFRMLDSLFRQAGQYELVPALLNRLELLAGESISACRSLTGEYPHWSTCAKIWHDRLNATRRLLEELGTSLLQAESRQI